MLLKETATKYTDEYKEVPVQDATPANAPMADEKVKTPSLSNLRVERLDDLSNESDIWESGTIQLSDILRKDFTIDPYMIYQAKLFGASAVLLIAAILSDKELKQYFELADTLGLSCLFEAHDAEEVKRCLAAGARVLGVNNRNLKDFSVDINNSVRLREMVPDDIIFVSESGMSKPEDIQILKENGTDAVLIGEMLMRSADKKSLISAIKTVQKYIFINDIPRQVRYASTIACNLDIAFAQDANSPPD